MTRRCNCLLASSGAGSFLQHSFLMLMLLSAATTTIEAFATFQPSSYVVHQQRQQQQQQQQQQNLRNHGVFFPTTTKTPSGSSTTTSLHMMEAFMDPSSTWDALSSLSSSTFIDLSVTSSLSSSPFWLSFADQGQNLAGIFFQASLLPYLLFLYFLSFRANRIPPLGNFGFQFVLLFVLSTIPSGIISKSTYGVSLADCDWLHGGAEALLTIANILIVLGLKDALTKASFTPTSVVTTSRNYALAAFGIFAAACALGPTLLGLEGAHAPFFFGLGNIPHDVVVTLPWVTHTEPINALSIPTWMIHFSSVFEYLIAMQLVWDYSKTTQNPKWKGLTWGMLPLHASGICACTYHIFFNSMQFLVSMQAGLTLLGNVGCALAAYRIAKSNGWTFDEINPFPKSNTDPTGLIADGIASMPLVLQPSTTTTTTTTTKSASTSTSVAVSSSSSSSTSSSTTAETNAALLLKVLGLTVVTSYLVKYGELGIDVFFTPNPPLALALVLGIPALTAYNFYNLQDERGGDNSNNKNADNKKNIFNFFRNTGGGGDDDDRDGSNNQAPALSMDTIKQYGVAGTVAYVLTELAFWIVAFPVAAYALYQSTGHWPDVITDNTDRAAVLAFIFAGANIARAMVPLRLGAALALAPWVDENLLQQLQLFQTPTKSTTTSSLSLTSLTKSSSTTTTTTTSASSKSVVNAAATTAGTTTTTTTPTNSKAKPQQPIKNAVIVDSNSDAPSATKEEKKPSMKKNVTPAVASYFMTNKE